MNLPLVTERARLVRIVLPVRGVGVLTLSSLSERPADAPPGSTATLELCREMLESLGDASGLVFIEDGLHHTRMCLDRGRIAWIHSQHCGRFLASRLQETLAMPSQRFRAVLAECKAEGSNLGEYLVHNGLLSRDAFRCILRDHSAEHLWAMLRSTRANEDYWSFEPRPQRYSHAFTFSLDELSTLEVPATQPASNHAPKARRSGHTTVELLPPADVVRRFAAIEACLKSAVVVRHVQAVLVIMPNDTVLGADSVDPSLQALAKTARSQHWERTIATSSEGIHVLTRLVDGEVLVVSATPRAQLARLLFTAESIQRQLQEVE